MRRLPILAALVLAALIAASAWLAIEAESDPEPLTTTEHLPRDDEQAQQAQAQSQPDEPDGPEDESESESSDQDSDSDQVAPAQSEEPASLEDGSDDQSGDAASDEHADAEQQEQSGQAEESATMSDEDIAERRLIKALDIDRRPHDQSAPAARQHTVEEGETLLGIADAYGVDIQRLLDDNDLALDAILHVGENPARALLVHVHPVAGHAWAGTLLRRWPDLGNSHRHGARRYSFACGGLHRPPSRSTGRARSRHRLYQPSTRR